MTAEWLVMGQTPRHHGAPSLGELLARPEALTPGNQCLLAAMDCSPPGSSVHGILQASTLEWVAIPFSRASSQPRD